MMNTSLQHRRFPVGYVRPRYFRKTMVKKTQTSYILLFTLMNPRITCHLGKCPNGNLQWVLSQLSMHIFLSQSLTDVKSFEFSIKQRHVIGINTYQISPNCFLVKA